MKQFAFTVPGKPVGKMRPRVVKRGNFATKPTVEYEKLIRQRAIDAGVEMMNYCRVFIAVYLPMRKKEYKTKPNEWLEPRKRPNLDNICKSVLDAIEGVAFKNDKDVMSVEMEYRFAKHLQPSLSIWIAECDWLDYIFCKIKWNEESEL